MKATSDVSKKCIEESSTTLCAKTTTTTTTWRDEDSTSRRSSKFHTTVMRKRESSWSQIMKGVLNLARKEKVATRIVIDAPKKVRVITK